MTTLCSCCSQEPANETGNGPDCGQAAQNGNNSHEKKAQRPWLRFWVRHFDSFLFFILARGILAVYGVFSWTWVRHYIPFLLTSLFAILIESLFISSIAVTPGKWLANITVKTIDGKNPTYLQALKRTAGAWVLGMALGFPFVSLVPMWLAKRKLCRDGKTWWDKWSGTEVIHKPVPFWRHAIIVILASFILFLVYMTIIDFYSSRTK